MMSCVDGAGQGKQVGCACALIQHLFVPDVPVYQGGLSNKRVTDEYYLDEESVFVLFQLCEKLRPSRHADAQLH